VRVSKCLFIFSLLPRKNWVEFISKGEGMEFQDFFLLISVMWFISLFGKVCRIFLYLADNIRSFSCFSSI